MIKNRLYMSRCYGCGAMDRSPDGGVQWREKIEEWLNSRGIIFLNPVNKPCNVGIENKETRKARHEAKDKGDYSLLLADRPVRAVDLRMVDVSDFLIVNLDLTESPCGTYEELFWANREKKPILVRVEQGKNAAPDWLWWTIPHEHIFSTWKELKFYIDHVAFDEDDKVDRFKRWIFFDFTDITNKAIEGFEKFSSTNPVYK